MTDKLEIAIEQKRRDSVLDPSGFAASQRICCTSLTKDLDKVKPIGWMVCKKNMFDLYLRVFNFF
jgi:hypothetical protein